MNQSGFPANRVGKSSVTHGAVVSRTYRIIAVKRRVVKLPFQKSPFFSQVYPQTPAVLVFVARFASCDASKSAN